MRLDRSVSVADVYSVSTQEKASVGAVNPGSLSVRVGMVRVTGVGIVKSTSVGKSGMVTVIMSGTVIVLRVGATAANDRSGSVGGSGISARVAGTVGGLASVYSVKVIVDGAV